MHNKKNKSKADLIDEVRRVIRASLGNRAKESLVVDFINQTDLDQIGDKASVIEAFLPLLKPNSNAKRKSSFKQKT